MKKFVLVLGIIVGSLVILVLMAILLTPSMEKWGSTQDERNSVLPGDELVKKPARVANHALTINAAPERTFQWLQQIGADKSGMYSYTWLENLVGCKMAKIESINPDWQNLKEGDLMKMCAGDFAPPPYMVAEVIPNQAIIFGHKTDTQWEETWQFVLIPQPDGTTRLVSRTRSEMTGFLWEVVNRISFVMERKMLLTIKGLSEGPK